MKKIWTPPTRPEWVKAVNEEGRAMDLSEVVPLEPDELIDTAIKGFGRDNFGEDNWREGFDILVKSINDEADLNLFGRIMTRSELLLLLKARLGIEAAYEDYPEIEKEEIVEPVFIAGLPRSGTSILFEVLSQDNQFGVPTSWETMFPYPPPEAASYNNDPRVNRADSLVTLWERVAPTFKTMHESGGNMPTECVIAWSCTFRSENFPSLYQVPSYAKWLTSSDIRPAYQYYKRMLKVLQYKNPRKTWLFKSPSHIAYMPSLFEVFPDARVIITHRDPLKAHASVTNLLGTMYWMRSDQAFDEGSFEELLSYESVAARLDQIVDWLEQKTIPVEQVFSSLYSSRLENPIESMADLYKNMGMTLSETAREAMSNYLKSKPPEKFGKHEYVKKSDSRLREIFNRYQSFFNVPNEM